MNRASVLYATALFALASSATGCYRGPDASWYRDQGMGPGGASADGWTRIAPTGTGMAFLLPAPPRVQANQEIQDDGTPVTLTRAACETPFANFIVSIVDSDGGLYGDPLREADRVAERIAGNLELQDRRTTRLDVAGFYGREEVGRTAEGVFVAMRIYIGVRRVYVAFVATPPGGEVGAAERFMSSVELDPSDALYPVAVEHGSAAVTWSPLFMPEDDFAVRMPVITGVTSTILQVGDVSSSMRTYEALSEGTHYRVRVLPFTGTLPELVEVASALSLGATSRPAHASGYPGVEVARENAGGNSLLIRAPTRIYVMEVETASNADNVGSRAFFDSLRIL